MAGKKKSRFKLRYLIIMMIIIGGYFFLKSRIPIKGYELVFPEPADSKRKGELETIVKKLKDGRLSVLKDSLRQVNWIENVRMSRGFDGILTIKVYPRKPVARLAGKKGLCMDESGHYFRVDNVSDIPVIHVKSDSLKKDITSILEICSQLKFTDFEGIRIEETGLITAGKNLSILWGRSNYDKKTRLLRKFIKKISPRKGIIDLRFQNMVVLRR